MDIKELRNIIDETDDKVCELLKTRMETSYKIAQYKKEHNLPILAPIRERKILSRLSAISGEELEMYIRTIYKTIFDVSRSYQTRLIGSENESYKKIIAAAESTDKVFPKRASVACQGREGAYSQLAAERLFVAPSIVYNAAFEGVFKAVSSGLCEFGILPVENSTAGSVNAVYDLLIKYDVSIVRSVRIKVDHNLLVIPGTKLSDIKEIYTHEQAISQCSNFLSELKGVSIIPYANTASAAEAVANAQDKKCAAISSRFCAELYGLETLSQSVQNLDNNYTRFICFTKNPRIHPGADRTSIMMVIPNKAGSLFRVLSRFNAIGLNLLKLESRPIPERDFESMFYFDVEESVASPQFAELITELENTCEKFKYLGTYTEIV